MLRFQKTKYLIFQYTKLSRNEKIDRLFIVLNLLVKLMEINLSIWIVRYPFETRKSMSNSNTCPLIAHLLWKGKDDCGEANTMIRNIIKVFATCIWIDFPNDKIDIVAVSKLCTMSHIKTMFLELLQKIRESTFTLWGVEEIHNHIIVFD